MLESYYDCLIICALIPITSLNISISTHRSYISNMIVDNMCINCV